MTILRSPSGAVIHASGGLADRLRKQGWIVSDDTQAPGLRLVTAADLEAVQATVATFTPGLAPRVDALEEAVPQVAAEVGDLALTIAAPAAKADVLEAQVASILAAIQAFPPLQRLMPPTKS